MQLAQILISEKFKFRLRVSFRGYHGSLFALVTCSSVKIQGHYDNVNDVDFRWSKPFVSGKHCQKI